MLLELVGLAWVVAAGASLHTNLLRIPSYSGPSVRLQLVAEGGGASVLAF